MTNSETRFGIHILFFSVPSLRKRWFRSRSTRSSRRRRGNPQLSPREGFSQTCGVAPRSRPRCEGRTANPKTPNGCAQPPPRSDAQLPPRSGTTGPGTDGAGPNNSPGLAARVPWRRRQQTCPIHAGKTAPTQGQNASCDES
jgi:hypothetical protein